MKDSTARRPTGEEGYQSTTLYQHQNAGQESKNQEGAGTASPKVAPGFGRGFRFQRPCHSSEVATVPDPNHAAVKDSRDALESIVTLLAATLAEDAKAETAVRVSQSCNSPRAVESFCRLVNVDYGALTRYTTSSESDLRRLQTARDSNGVIVRAVLAVNYAAPAKPQAPVVFIPDTRSADEKLRDAKASVRQS
jgi:hypothetical protein